MANVPLSSLKFPGLSDTYTIPQIDNTLSIAGKAADAKATGDAIADLFKNIKDTIPSNTVSGHIAHFEDATGDLLLKDLTVNIDYNANGWTGATLTKTGQNMVQFAPVDYSSRYGVNYSITSEGKLTIAGTATSNSQPYVTNTATTLANMQYGPYPAGTYTVTATGFVGPTTSNRIIFNAKYTDDTELLSDIRISGEPGQAPDGTGRAYTFTATKPFKFGLYALIPSGSTVNCEVGLQLEVGTVLHDWEALQKADYPMSWQTQAGTIYGGTLDLLNGVLTSTLAQDGTELSTPVEYSIDPVDISPFQTVNNIWASTGDITVSYYSTFYEIVKTTYDIIYTTKEYVIVLDNHSNYSDGGMCLYKAMPYSEEGYLRNNGTYVYPVADQGEIPDANAPVETIMSLIRSYVDNSALVYGQGNHGMFGTETTNEIDCSEFVSAILQGIPYETSKYVADSNNCPVKVMNGSFSKTGSPVRFYTSKMAQYFAEQKRLFSFDYTNPRDIKNLQFGDIIFISDDATETMQSRYLHIRHVAFVLGTSSTGTGVLVAEAGASGPLVMTTMGDEVCCVDYLLFANNTSDLYISSFARPDYAQANCTSFNDVYNFINSDEYKITFDGQYLPGLYINANKPEFPVEGSASQCVGLKYYAAIPGAKIAYTGPARDNENKTYFVQFFEYDEHFAPIRRQFFNMSDLAPLTLDSSTRYIRFTAGYGSSQNKNAFLHCADNFSVKIYSDGTTQKNAAANTTGAINALYSIAEDYLNYAYQGNNISGLVYISEKDASASSAYTPTVTPIQTSGGVDQYSIQCSGFANLLLRAVPFVNSRYKTGTSGANTSLPWGYVFDKESSLKDSSYKDVVWSYNLLKYAEWHGYAYTVSADGDNVRAGDLLFTYSTTSNNYRGINHVAVCLSCGADGKATIAEATNTTRTSGGNTYSVGLAVNQIDLKNNTSILYGARFPLGDVDQNAKVIYRQNPSLSSTISSGAIIGSAHTVDMPQGLYTVVVRGSFTNEPVIKIRYAGSSDYIEVAPMHGSGNIHTLTVYAEAPVQYIDLYAPSDGTVCSGYNLFEVAHGYISPNIVEETVVAEVAELKSALAEYDVVATMADLPATTKDYVMVLDTISDYCRGGTCIFKKMPYTTYGYARDDGSRVYPVPDQTVIPSATPPYEYLMPVIASYMDNSNLVYGSNYGLFDSTVNGEVDCSDFVSAVLQGVTYGMSRYVGDANIATNKILNNALSNTYVPAKLHVRTMAQFFAENKRLFSINSNNPYFTTSKLQFGDILFINDGTDTNNERYYNLGHVLFVIAPAYNSRYVLCAQCGGTPSELVQFKYGTNVGNMVMLNMSAANIASYIPLFARPDYAVTQDIKNYKISGGNTITFDGMYIPGMHTNTTGNTLEATGNGGVGLLYYSVVGGTKIHYTGPATTSDNIPYRAYVVEYDRLFNALSRTRFDNADVTFNASTTSIRIQFGLQNSTTRTVQYSDGFDFSAEIIS